jgi:hypothetical protein
MVRTEAFYSSIGGYYDCDFGMTEASSLPWVRKRWHSSLVLWVIGYKALAGWRFANSG